VKMKMPFLRALVSVYIGSLLQKWESFVHWVSFAEMGIFCCGNTVVKTKHAASAGSFEGL